MENCIYAGIGSRKTPCGVLGQMQHIAKELALQGWLLRSGNCLGADQAFQMGANSVSPSLVHVFIPWLGYESQSIAVGNVVATPCSGAYRIAAKYHPAWQKCSRAAQALHARNVHIVLGENLDSPVRFLVCWTPKGLLSGGTAMGIRIAQAFGIPVVNLAIDSCIPFVDLELQNRSVTQVEFDW